MSTNNEQKARQLVIEAEKKLNSSKSFFGSLFGGTAKQEDAVECYQRAANLFKMSKNWTSAACAFFEAAKLHFKSGSRHDAATNYVDAANCYKKIDIDEAVNSLIRAIEIYIDLGRFTMAAKHHLSIAEMYGCVNLERAVQHYEQAADYYRGEENNISANKCLIKVAQYEAQMENYNKAIIVYEQLATSSLEIALLKFSAKDYLFKAALCHMCVDILNAQHAIERYILMFPAFQDSRECKLVQTLIDNIEEQNVEGFTDAVTEYDSISRLDQWYTMVLLRIKKTINGNPDLR